MAKTDWRQEVYNVKVIITLPRRGTVCIFISSMNFTVGATTCRSFYLAMKERYERETSMHVFIIKIFWMYGVENQITTNTRLSMNL